ncbi:MAG TPA: glycosyltransferase [Gammaproteobacteria bacterium]|jgi:glycosyltransferase involved in cell wall biosynthesis
MTNSIRLTASVRAPAQTYSRVDALERIRLVKFLTIFGIGGTEKQVVNLAKRMDRSAFDLSFGCTNRWGALLDEVVKRQGIEVSEYPLKSLYDWNAVRQQIRFSRALRKSRTQIVHSYNFYANVFCIPAAKLAGVPCVVASIRDLGIYLSPTKLMLQRWICRLADRIVVNADAIRDWLVEQGYPAHKIVVIRNGVDTSRFGARNDGAALRRELGLPPTSPLVTMLARLSPTKGIDYFLEAAAKLRDRHPEARFLLVGECFTRDSEREFMVDHAYRKVLQDKVDSLGLTDRVTFTGLRKDVPDVLAASTVSVLPSLSEGISNTLLESMAAGVPVVATQVGGTPEAVADGEQGLLVPPGDSAALASAISRVLSDPLLAQRLGANGRRRAVEEFSFEAVVRRTEALYRDLLAANRG